MKCTLNSNIKNLSGKQGNLLFKTFHRPDGSTETRAYLLPKRKNGKHGFERTTPPSDAELKNRSKFATACALYKNISDAERDFWRKLWIRNKYRLNGKKYNTLRGFFIASIIKNATH